MVMIMTFMIINNDDDDDNNYDHNDKSPCTDDVPRGWSPNCSSIYVVLKQHRTLKII